MGCFTGALAGVLVGVLVVVLAGGLAVPAAKTVLANRIGQSVTISFIKPSFKLTSYFSAFTIRFHRLNGDIVISVNANAGRDAKCLPSDLFGAHLRMAKQRRSRRLGISAAAANRRHAFVWFNNIAIS